MKLAAITDHLQDSQILSISNRIKQRILAGEKMYNLTVGDFDPTIFPIPELLEEYIHEAYRNKYTNYPPSDGLLELRESIAQFLMNHKSMVYHPSEIVVAGGGRPLIYATYKMIVDPGDKVLFPVPSWNNQYYTYLAGGTAVEIQTTAKNHFMPTADQLVGKLNDAVLLVLCSPLNPTGTLIRKKDLKEISELVHAENLRRGENEKKLYILFDQMYWLLTSDHETHYDPVTVYPEIKPYVIYIDAISKSFAATGLRVGWAAGPAVLIHKMKSFLSHVGAWAPMAEQKGVAAFLKNEDQVKSFLKKFKSELTERLELLYHGILKLKQEGLSIDAIPPQGGIYLSVKLDFENAHQVLLEKAGVGLLPFEVFGTTKETGWHRLSIGTCKKEEVLPLLNKIRQVLIEVENFKKIKTI